MSSSGPKVGSAYIEVTPKLAGDFKSIVEKAMPSGSDGGKSFGGGFSEGMKGSISAGAVAVGNILSDVVKSGASAAKDLIGDAISGFSDFEQLSGGVEKLFGEDAAQTVMANAERAFSSAGMSANQYMEQATSFSASLIGSLGGDTAKAAELTDVAMRAMSDNVNVFGSDMQDVQNAFQGFAKQNYTMLDNLKLGYGGTKGEMERLIADANEYAAANGQAADLSIDSFADIVQAIELVQEKQGIAGTTAKEAASTVEGSVNMMKASWENWVAALGRDDVDMSAMTSQLLESVTTAAQNVLPRVTQIFSSITAALPELVAGIAPALASAVSDLVSTLVPALVGLLPVLLEAGLQLFTGLVQALGEIAPQLTAMLPGLISQLLSVLVSNLPALVSGAIQLFAGIAVGLVQAAPQIIATLVELIPQLVAALIGAVPQMLGAAGQLFGAVGRALVEVGPMIIDALGYLITHLPEIILGGIGGMVDAAGQFFGGIIDGITGKQPEVDKAASDMAESAVDSAFASSDAGGVADNITSTMASSFDFSSVDSAVTGGVEAAAAQGVAAADGSAVSEKLTETMARSVKTDALSRPAAALVGNAISSARQAIGAADIGREFSERAAAGVDAGAMAGPAAEMARAASEALDVTATVKVEADTSGADAAMAAARAMAASFMASQSAVSAAMSAASSSAERAGDDIRRALSGLDFEATIDFNLGPLPHFSLEGKFDAEAGTVPEVKVDWWASGGIFTKPTIFANGVGERGPEAVLPLERLPELLDLERGGDVFIHLDYNAGEDGAQVANDIYRRLRQVGMARGVDYAYA